MIILRRWVNQLALVDFYSELVVGSTRNVPLKDIMIIPVSSTQPEVFVHSLNTNLVSAPHIKKMII